MNRRILFFSSVKDPNLFNITGFYVEDINALKLAGYSVETTNSLFKFMCFWKYDIAFLYFYTKALIPAIFAWCCRKKIYYTGGIDALNDNVEIKGNKNIPKLFFILNYLLANNCNIVSQADLEGVQKLLAKFHIKPKKLMYFPHSVSIDRNVTLPLDQKKNIITSICWMAATPNVKRKGLDKLLYIFKAILIKQPDFKLYLIGSWGEGKEYLDQIVAKLGLKSQVVFTGQISETEKLSILDMSKYYFQLSTYEGFGIAVLEAMVMGNFVFHSNQGGLKDTMGDCGFIVKNPDEIADIVLDFERINESYGDYATQLVANRQMVTTKFSTQNRAHNFKKMIN